MHPINSANFGTAATDILVKFYDGSALKNGYIVKQIGSTTFIVSNGATTKTVSLATTTNLAQILTGEVTLDGPAVTDLCTVTLTENANTHYVTKFSSYTLATTAGAVWSWTGGTASGTVYKVGTFSDITPVNSVLPAISGTKTVGQTLTSTSGTWSNTPSSYTYQWNRDGVAITSATASTYVLQAADEATVITVTVNAVKVPTTPTAVTSAGYSPIAAA